MSQRVHHHPCRDCKAKVECGGEWEQNYDGMPEVICPEYHKRGGWIEDVRCDDCQTKWDAQCAADLGENL